MILRPPIQTVGLCAIVASLLLTAACTDSEPAPQPQSSSYVALGDSAVAGAGIGPPQGPCQRSDANYPSLIAKTLDLPDGELTDVSCPGATTKDVLLGRDRPSPLPPQVEAIDADTDVVTISVGGNDAGYIPSLFALCYAPPRASSAACGTAADRLPALLPGIQAGVIEVLDEIKLRAPDALVVLVSYLRLMPDGGSCDADRVPVERAELLAGAAAEGRLEGVMRDAAKEAGASYVSMRAASSGHDACASKADAWVSGIKAEPGDGSPLHPRAEGMEAVARAVLPVVKSRLTTVE